MLIGEQSFTMNVEEYITKHSETREQLEEQLAEERNEWKKLKRDIKSKLDDLVKQFPPQLEMMDNILVLSQFWPSGSNPSSMIDIRNRNCKKTSL
jgi:Tfp pilus assembly protein PilO